MHTLKKFIPYYSPYKAVFVLDLICAAMISLIDLAYPQILRTMTKTVFAGKSSAILQVLLPIGVAMLIMYIVQALCKYYVSYQGHMMGANMERDMRQQLFDHYEKLSFSYYDQNNSGQMMSKLVSDLFDISEMAHHGPENLFEICVEQGVLIRDCSNYSGLRKGYYRVAVRTHEENQELIRAMRDGTTKAAVAHAEVLKEEEQA